VVLEMKGKIRQVKHYRVECAICDCTCDAEDLSKGANHDTAREEFKESGWHETTRGWVCPDCFDSKKHREK
jgi:hypothetical protein